MAVKAASLAYEGVLGAAAFRAFVRGVANEARALRDLGRVKNSVRVVGNNGVVAMPDALTQTVAVEVKDRLYVAYTAQLRAQAEAAQRSGRTAVLVTGPRTYVTQSVRTNFRVQTLPYLGP